MPYPLPLTRTEAYLAYKAGVIQQSDLKPSLAVPRNGIDAWLAYWTGLAEDYPKREDGTPHILQEEEAYIAYLCGVINEYPEKCLRRVGAYLRYLISARWGRPDHPLNREELYLSLIKTQFIPSGDPSSDIEIDGTAKAPFVEVKMFGDTFQQSYTGKNLLVYPYYNTTETVSGITFTDNGDGSVTVNGTTTGPESLFWITRDIWKYSTENIVVPAGTYTISPTGNSNVRLYLTAYGETQGLLASVDASTASTTFTIAEKASLTIRISVKPQGTWVTNLVIKPQLESGSTSTSFEPFVGGQPSPNPDYPQQIQTVTGEQTVTVTSKNLFSGQNLTEDSRVSTSNGVTYDRDGYEVSDYIEIEPSTNYALTCGNAQNGSYFSWYDSTKTYISGSGWQNKTVKTSPANASYIRFDFLASEVGIVQFEKGSVSSYVPYSNVSYPINLGSIELCKLGTYQDYIYKDGDSWKVHKATGKATFSSLNWQDYQIGSTGHYRIYSSGIAQTVLPPSANNVNFIGYCSIYTNKTSSRTYAREEGCSVQGDGYANTGTIFIYDADYDYSGAATNWKTARGAGQIYFVLKTATDTVITDATLIAQLEALVKGGSEEGTTYIKVSATDPNLPGLLYAEAPKYE